MTGTRNPSTRLELSRHGDRGRLLILFLARVSLVAAVPVGAGGFRLGLHVLPDRLGNDGVYALIEDPLNY